MRVCTICNKEKELNSVNFRPGTNLFRTYCRVCGNDKNTEWAKANSEKVKESQLRYAQSEKGRQKNKEYKEAHQEDFKRWKEENYQRHKEWYTDANKEWAKNNPKRKKEIANSYYERNREILKTKAKLSYNPEKARRNHLLNKYGITLEEFTALSQKQEDKCKLCGNKPEPLSLVKSKQSLHVDHCHKTGQIRGLLCFNCNTALGKFKEDVDILYKAITYLHDN